MPATRPGADRPKTAGPAARGADGPGTVAMVVDALSRGGAERVTLDVSKGLLERGYKVEIIDFSPHAPFSSRGSSAELAPPAGVGVWWIHPNWTRRLLSLVFFLLINKIGTVGRLPRWHPKRALHGIAWRWSRRKKPASFAGWRFRRKTARLAPHAVIVQEPWLTPFVAKALGSVKGSPPVVGVLHNGRPELLDGIARDLAEVRTAARVAPPGWAAVNPEFARPAAPKLGVDESEVVDLTNGCDTERVARMARDAKPAADGETILWAGRLIPLKRGEDAIAAFAAARARRPMRLLMLGEGGEHARLRALADATGFGADILLPGFAGNPYPDMAACGAFLLTSETEGLPLTLIEALSLGTFCVSTDCPYGPRHILNDPRLGRLAPVGDTGGLAEAMLAALGRRRTEPPGAREFRARNARERFGMEEALDRYHRLVASLRAGADPSRPG